MKKISLFILVAIFFASCGGVDLPSSEPLDLSPSELPVDSTADLQAQPSDEQVDAYIRENVSGLNPVQAVLGGTWYVVDIKFGPDGYVKVLCEDGHIESVFGANYAFDENGDLELNNIVELPNFL